MKFIEILFSHAENSGKTSWTDPTLDISAAARELMLRCALQVGNSTKRSGKHHICSGRLPKYALNWPCHDADTRCYLCDGTIQTSIVDH